MEEAYRSQSSEQMHGLLATVAELQRRVLCLEKDKKTVSLFYSSLEYSLIIIAINIFSLSSHSGQRHHGEASSHQRERSSRRRGRPHDEQTSAWRCRRCRAGRRQSAGGGDGGRVSHLFSLLYLHSGPHGCSRGSDQHISTSLPSGPLQTQRSESVSGESLPAGSRFSERCLPASVFFIGKF